MYLVVGLGNPGDEYAKTRHNAGFNVVDALGEAARANYWKSECGALTAKVKIAGEEAILAKPQSFMNASGGPISKLVAQYDVPLERLVVIHDDLDILPGTIRVKFGGGLAGHNGLKSIHEKLGSLDWLRVRVGIGKPEGNKPVIDYVLQAPKGQAADDFADACQQAAEATQYLLENGLEATQQKFN